MLSYKELNRRANLLANFLRDQHKISRGSVVGLLFHRCHHWLVSMIAVLKAGAAYVPIDPAYPQGRIAYMLRDSGAKCVLTHARVPQASYADCGAPALLVDRDWEARIARGGKPDNPSSGVTPADLVYIVYTSGTTGEPKGVMINHRSLAGVQGSVSVCACRFACPCLG